MMGTAGQRRSALASKPPHAHGVTDLCDHGLTALGPADTCHCRDTRRSVLDGPFFASFILECSRTNVDLAEIVLLSNFDESRAALVRRLLGLYGAIGVEDPDPEPTLDQLVDHDRANVPGAPRDENQPPITGSSRSDAAQEPPHVGSPRRRTHRVPFVTRSALSMRRGIH